MSFYSAATIDKIEEKCRVFYIDQSLARGWNENRRGNELRLLTGWTLIERGGQRRTRTGFKSKSAALRAAYYLLLEDREQPADVERPRLKRVA